MDRAQATEQAVQALLKSGELCEGTAATALPTESVALILRSGPQGALQIGTLYLLDAGQAFAEPECQVLRWGRASFEEARPLSELPHQRLAGASA